jgi:hypothetical protein
MGRRVSMPKCVMVMVEEVYACGSPYRARRKCRRDRITQLSEQPSNPQALRIGANEERAMNPHEMQDHLVLLLHCFQRLERSRHKVEQLLAH